MSIHLESPEEIKHTDTEWIRIQIPDTVEELLNLADGNHLVEVEVYVGGRNLGRIGKRVSGGWPIRCRFEWLVGKRINGRLNREFDVWLDGNNIGPGKFHGGSRPWLHRGDKFILNLVINP